jgi:VanZ family protein
MTQLIKKLLAGKNTLPIAIVYTLLITIAFLSPSSGMPRVFFKIPYLPFDKLVHFVLHSILSFVWLTFIWKQVKNKLKSKNILFILLACIGYGIIIEILQDKFVPSRQADWQDVIANVLGTLGGMLFFFKYKNRFIT